MIRQRQSQTPAAKSDTHNLGVTATGEGNGREDLWQEYVVSGSQRAKCETRQRHGEQ